MQQEREGGARSFAVCSPSFHCVVEERKDCEELKPKPKEKWVFVDLKNEVTKHRTEWCAENQQVSVHEVWKKQQIHEDARKMHRTKKKRQLGGHDLVSTIDRQ